jgi:hypothetical protein
MHLAARASAFTARATIRAGVVADVEPVPRKWMSRTVVIGIS